MGRDNLRHFVGFACHPIWGVRTLRVVVQDPRSPALGVPRPTCGSVVVKPVRPNPCLSPSEDNFGGPLTLVCCTCRRETPAQQCTIVVHSRVKIDKKMCADDVVRCTECHKLKGRMNRVMTANRELAKDSTLKFPPFEPNPNRPAAASVADE